MQPIINKLLMKARKRDFSAKLFYSLMREFTEKGISVCDIGSTIEIFDESEKKILEKIISESHKESLAQGEYSRYGSSWGTLELRKTIVGFFEKWGVLGINPKTEVMVSRGIIDSIQKVINSLEITHVIVPSFAPFYPETFAILRGKKIIFANLDLITGNFDLSDLEKKVKKSGAKKGKILMYITNPSAPAGTMMQNEFVENSFIPFLKENGIWLISDSYISSINFYNQPIRPILSFKEAKDVAVEAVTMSKEIGLPGIRVGGMAGNEKIIEAVRIYVATSTDIISLPLQHLAAKALGCIDQALVGKRIIKEVNEEILPRFKAMGWPTVKPKAGIDMLVSIPPKFILESGGIDPALLASFSILRRFGIALFPCSVFAHNEKEKHFFRLVLKQKQGKIAKALDFLKKKGFNYKTYKSNQKDISFLNERTNSLDLTKL